MNIEEIVAEALAVVKRGGIILYPTDTVWGIGCDATNEEAVQKVFALKKRSEAKSLVLLAGDFDMVARYVKKIPPMAVDLVEVNDVPMTLVYPGAVVSGVGLAPSAGSVASGYGLAPSVVAEDGSVGIRIPRVEGCRVSGKASSGKAGGSDVIPDGASAGAVFCNKLIYKLRRPLVSTSANISGEPTPNSFKEISSQILEGVDYCVPEVFGDQRKCRFDDSATGRSSQIIKLGLEGEVEIIRP